MDRGDACTRQMLIACRAQVQALRQDILWVHHDKNDKKEQRILYASSVMLTTAAQFQRHMVYVPCRVW